jgi:putative transposase
VSCLPDAITVVWPQAVVQLRVVHLIRASLRYASRKYWAPLAKGLRPVCTATDENAAAAALEEFAAAWGDRYPAIVKVWRAHWAEFVPFLAFPPEVRRVTCTTNLIESMNARLRKVTRNRGQFPSEQAALKVLYLAVRNLQDYRRPNTGIRSSEWKQELQAFTIYFDGRIPTP